MAVSPYSNAPLLFDRLAARRFRARADRQNPINFLRIEVADRLLDRLADIKRDFSAVGDLGGDSPASLKGAVIPLDGLAGENHDATGIAHDLGMTPHSFDLITSILHLHAQNDLPGTLIQSLRGLKPDGLFMAALFAGETLTELRQSLIAAEAEVTGGVHPRVMPFGDVRDLGSLLQRAGFALPVTDLDTLTVTYEHPLKLMTELRGMGEANYLMGRRRQFTRRSVLLRAAEIYQDRFGTPDGRIPATFQIAWMTGWHPHDSQQKPAKRGSGKVNLATALGQTPPVEKS